jgi:hypothetical protein
MRHSFLQISLIGIVTDQETSRASIIHGTLLWRVPFLMTACELLTSRFFIDPRYSSVGGSPAAVSTLNSQGFSSK